MDAAHSDYALREGSPAIARGFEPLRLEAAGPDWEAAAPLTTLPVLIGLGEKAALSQ